MDKASVDYTLYLVTDSTMIPANKTFLDQVSQAIDNGVTLVQLREKSLLTLDFINRAKETLQLCRKKGIPLIINDRVDVALAVDADGVHVGQDDMPATLVRKLIGPDKILGLSCGIPLEMEKAIEEGVVDYVGFGAMFPTKTKKDIKLDRFGQGPIGIRRLLRTLEKHNSSSERKIKCVAIGGINQSNAAKVLYQLNTPTQKVDGLAVVSCIMAAPDAAKATKDLIQIIHTPAPWTQALTITKEEPQSLENKIKTVTAKSPLVHHITNGVVKNFSANVTLAIGASPIMSEFGDEYEEFASTIDNICLVLNIGTPSPEMMNLFKHALQTYNKYGRMILLDPVACGATQARLNVVKELLNYGQVNVIKGNIGEISGILKLTSTYKQANGNEEEVLMKGVDSIAQLNEDDIISTGKQVSKDFKVVVVISGPINYVIHQDRYKSIPGGHPLMGTVTGTGCSLGSTIGSFIGAQADGRNKDKFDVYEAVIGAVELYNKAGREAAEEAKGSGTFMVKFIDKLFENTHNI
ncbi:uncharacterized protein KQ657_003538 [Scheffersomyces spartinae]|uniref:Thiamine phosphate synthase/TenI domain-containing protein n=1 Tax=Scheffersomyces spartinae TaxID=45513 RepID=A0A9P8AFW5_9ASCO|nr:uncharacterized protein KQ657_003538 [Scheffersomyces spartinae]KAG7191333.1 hypothetical protein KQ657_003538 [Scheffersomyces spartinae]